MAARQAHNLKVGGSIPPPATYHPHDQKRQGADGESHEHRVGGAMARNTDFQTGNRRIRPYAYRQNVIKPSLRLDSSEELGEGNYSLGLGAGAGRNSLGVNEGSPAA